MEKGSFEQTSKMYRGDADGSPGIHLLPRANKPSWICLHLFGPRSPDAW